MRTFRKQKPMKLRTGAKREQDKFILWFQHSTYVFRYLERLQRYAEFNELKQQEITDFYTLGFVPTRGTL